MRVVRTLMTLLAFAAAIPAAAQSDSAVHRSPAAAEVSTPSVHPASVSTVRAAYPHDTVPAPTQKSPLSVVGLGAFIGATAKRGKTTRKAAGKKRDVPMFLDSDVHVMRKNDADRSVTTVVRGGRLLDDLEEDELTDDEIDELTARRVVRPATPIEIERADQQDRAAQREDLTATQTTEVAQLRANREAERAGLVTQGVAPADLVSFDEATTTQVATLQEKHAAALTKIDQA